MRHLKTILASAVAAAALSAAVPALAADVKVGILGDITGPIEALAPPIVAGAQLAFDEVNAQGGILGGGKIIVSTGDSACDPSVAGPAADKLVNTDKVTGIVGAFCTGATIGAATAAGWARCGRAVLCGAGCHASPRRCDVPVAYHYRRRRTAEDSRCRSGVLAIVVNRTGRWG